MHKIATSLQLKFVAVMGGVALLVLLVTAGGYLGVKGSVAAIERVNLQEISHEREVSAMVAAFKKQVQEWKNVLLRGSDDAQRNKYWGQFEGQEADIQRTGKALHASMAASGARELLGRFLAEHAAMGEAYRKGLQAFVDAGFVASAGDEAVKGIDRAPTRLLEDAAALIAADAAAAVEVAVGSAARASLAALLATLVALMLGAGVALWFFNRGVVRPASQVAAALDTLAGGDFRVDIAWHGKDEIGSLADSARRIRDDLGQLLRGLLETARDLDAASSEVAELGARNRTQLARQREATSQVATASEELAATAREVASGAATAAESATAANTATASGREVVQQAIDAIQLVDRDVTQVGQTLAELESRADAIGKVLDVIRGIAEQTNLLALNAAIEAARAGEQGRGFAVVADEVRSLAQRTQESTQEIQNTIEQLQAGSMAAVQAMGQGQARVAEGVTFTQQAGAALDEIAAAVNTIVDMNTQIATAAEEQGAVAADVSSNVSAIDRSSETLVEGAGALAETGHRIAAHSAQLVDSTSRFRV